MRKRDEKRTGWISDWMTDGMVWILCAPHTWRDQRHLVTTPLDWYSTMDGARLDWFTHLIGFTPKVHTASARRLHKSITSPFLLFPPKYLRARIERVLLYTLFQTNRHGSNRLIKLGLFGGLSLSKRGSNLFKKTFKSLAYSSWHHRAMYSCLSTTIPSSSFLFFHRRAQLKQHLPSSFIFSARFPSRKKKHLTYSTNTKHTEDTLLLAYYNAVPMKPLLLLPKRKRKEKIHYRWFRLPPSFCYISIYLQRQAYI